MLLLLVLVFGTVALLVAAPFSVAGWPKRERRQRAAWRELARRVGGSYRGPQPREALQAFEPAPWQGWRYAKDFRCTRSVEGPGFWILELFRFTDSESADVEVTLAVVALHPEPGAGLEPIAARDGHSAMTNARHLFLWRPGIIHPGRPVKAAKVPALLEQAFVLAGPRRSHPLASSSFPST